MEMKVYFIIITVAILLAAVHVTTQTTVTTDSGKVQGVAETTDTGTVTQFLGIPYAEPPVNKLRFKPTVPVKAWADTLDATTHKPVCLQPQYPIPPAFPNGLNNSEDCLYLNVFTPVNLNTAITEYKPVLVYIHGGSFVSGGPIMHTGAHIASQGDVVYVTIAYRLGLLGSLFYPSAGYKGNLLLQDQQEALKWLKKNARYFGGDPDKVTVWGQSAGSLSIGFHLLSPKAKGLFNRAIMESGSTLFLGHNSTDRLDRMTKIVKEMADDFKCKREKEAEMITCLQGVDGNALSLKSASYFALDFYVPYLDGEYFTDNPDTIFTSSSKSCTTGTGYSGTVSVTRSGRVCQAWASQTPHQHSQAAQLDRFPESSLEDAKNYCRNLGGTSTGPFCYTTDPQQRWEYCDVCQVIEKSNTSVEVLFGWAVDEGDVFLLEPRNYDFYSDDFGSESFNAKTNIIGTTEAPGNPTCIASLARDTYKPGDTAVLIDYRKAFMEMMNDCFIMPILTEALYYASQEQNKVHMFSFSHRMSFSKQLAFIRAGHLDMTAMLFPALMVNLTVAEKALRTRVVGYFTDFAKTGKPTNNWPLLKPDSMKYEEITLDAIVSRDLKGKRKKMTLWRDVIFRLRNQKLPCPKNKEKEGNGDTNSQTRSCGAPWWMTLVLAVFMMTSSV